MTEIKSFQEVINLWPTKAAFARDVKRYDPKAREPAVRDWHARNRIPDEWFDAVLSAAACRGFEEITYRLLSTLYRS